MFELWRDEKLIYSSKSKWLCKLVQEVLGGCIVGVFGNMKREETGLFIPEPVWITRPFTPEELKELQNV